MKSGTLKNALRRALKSFAQRYLLFRPLFLFIYMYILKAGFLDGRMDLRYCLLKVFLGIRLSSR
jgi:hypothetical protein